MSDAVRHTTVIVCASSTTLGTLLDRLGKDAARGLSEGRVFIDRKRAQSPSDRVRAGQEVALHPARTVRSDVKVLARWGGIVAVEKPSDLASVPDHHGVTDSLVGALVRVVGPEAKTWEPTSRLDVGVSGVVLFAANAEARRWLVRAREEKRYQRHYVAIATRAPLASSGVWGFPIGRGKDPHLRVVGGRDARPAQTRYSHIASARDGYALLALEPVTGRTHQLRVHTAHAGLPLLGDRSYGGATRLVGASGAVTPVSRVALHAAWVEVPLPEQASLWRVDAPVPNELMTLWEELGGSASEWPNALARW